jgi:hypothetical protein
MPNRIPTLLLASLFAALPSCGDQPTQAAAYPTEPKAVIGFQLELLKAGDVGGLKACLTERQREGVTQEAVDKGKANAGKYTLDDLVDKVELGEDAGHRTAKIMMKNGRTLTTLIETDGKWLADTLWFK